MFKSNGNSSFDYSRGEKHVWPFKKYIEIADEISAETTTTTRREENWILFFIFLEYCFHLFHWIARIHKWLNSNLGQFQRIWFYIFHLFQCIWNNKKKISFTTLRISHRVLKFLRLSTLNHFKYLMQISNSLRYFLKSLNTEWTKEQNKIHLKRFWKNKFENKNICIVYNTLYRYILYRYTFTYYTKQNTYT